MQSIKRKLQIKDVFLSSISIFLILCWATFWLPFVLLSILFRSPVIHRNFIFDKLESIFFKVLTALLFLPYTVHGKNNLVEGPAIVVVNHSSLLDIPIIAALLNGRSKVWYIFKSYAEIPIIGFFLRRALLVVYQDNSSKDVRAVVAGVRVLKKSNKYLIIFPEGARFVDEKVHDFKHGFALISRKCVCPVIPIYIKNLNTIFPPGSWFARRKPISVNIGEPFMIHEHESDQMFTQRVQKWFENQ